MRALIVRQPWAWAIMDGIKKFENRSWQTRYRGPIAIIAGASKASLNSGNEFCRRLGIEPPAELVFGCILGVVNLVDIILPSQSDDPFAEGPFCWRLESPVNLTQPVPYPGQLSLFSLPTGDQRTESLAAIWPNHPVAGP